MEFFWKVNLQTHTLVNKKRHRNNKPENTALNISDYIIKVLNRLFPIYIFYIFAPLN